MKYVRQLGASVFKVTDKSLDTHIAHRKSMMKINNPTTVLNRNKIEAVSYFRIQ